MSQSLCPSRCPLVDSDLSPCLSLFLSSRRSRRRRFLVFLVFVTICCFTSFFFLFMEKVQLYTMPLRGKKSKKGCSRDGDSKNMHSDPKTTVLSCGVGAFLFSLYQRKLSRVEAPSTAARALALELEFRSNA